MDGSRLACALTCGAIVLTLCGCAQTRALTAPTPGPARQAPAATPATVRPHSAGVLDAATVSAAAEVSPKVVLVRSAAGLGSGEIIDARGYIVTNYHVIADRRFNPAPPFTVGLSNGRSYKALLAGADAADDLAVLKIKAGTLKPITLGDSSTLHVGQIVLAVGNPLGYAQTVTLGIISTLGRGLAEHGPATFLPDLIQTSAPINPGNSGGALVDLQGRLIGIPTLAAQDPEQGTAAQGIGFAIPVNRMRFITAQIIAGGKVTNTGRAYLGIDGREVTPDLQQQYGLPVDHGVLVAGLVAHGPAASAGVRAGDIIVALDGTALQSNADLLDALAQRRPGQSAHLELVGATGSRRTVTVTLGTLPAR